MDVFVGGRDDRHVDGLSGVVWKQVSFLKRVHDGRQACRAFRVVTVFFAPVQTHDLLFVVGNARQVAGGAGGAGGGAGGAVRSGDGCRREGHVLHAVLKGD